VHPSLRPVYAADARPALSSQAPHGGDGGRWQQARAGWGGGALGVRGGVCPARRGGGAQQALLHGADVRSLTGLNVCGAPLLNLSFLFGCPQAPAAGEAAATQMGDRQGHPSGAEAGVPAHAAACGDARTGARLR
jgi:hypothetical protein